MTVVCAWCQQQGRPAVIGEKAPRDGGVTHGICDDHAILLLAEIRKSKRGGSSPRLDSARPDLPAGPVLEPSRERAGRSSRGPPMKVVCAWRQQQGRPAVIREDGPLDDAVLRRLCDDHAVQLLAEVREALARRSLGPHRP